MNSVMIQESSKCARLLKYSKVQ